MGFVPRKSRARPCFPKVVNLDAGTCCVPCRNVSGFLCHQEPEVAESVFPWLTEARGETALSTFSCSYWLQWPQPFWGWAGKRPLFPLLACALEAQKDFSVWKPPVPLLSGCSWMPEGRSPLIHLHSQSVRISFWSHPASTAVSRWNKVEWMKWWEWPGCMAEPVTEVQNMGVGAYVAMGHGQRMELGGGVKKLDHVPICTW